MGSPGVPDFRLPDDIVPYHYDLKVVTYLGCPNKDIYSFKGNVEIKVKCLKETNTIKIHAKELTIINEATSVESTLIHDDPETLTVRDTLILDPNDFYVITLKNELENGKHYNLKLAFEGTLKDNMVGYYRSTFHDRSSSSVKSLAVTHFEPTDARRAFPCFDEPSMKATFRICLGHHKELRAISNMPVDSKFSMEGEIDFIWSQFETTHPMSTYLVAYMVGDLGCIENLDNLSKIPFRIWSRKDAMAQSAFPATYGPKFLMFYEDFFGVKYPLPKQDLIAVPDFKIGAMENWGLITFREASLLVDVEKASATVMLHVATIMAHELAHMWFGNLVTMNWWTDLWLKEGFATYMAALAVHHVFPRWNSLDAEALSDLLRVFHLDSLKSSHPVSVPIEHPNEISQIFDAISYDKGSFLLRMISLFLGAEVFRHGVSEYLKKHEFSNAEQDDLWTSLTQQAHRYSVLPSMLSVKEIMDTWTLQTGYPIITVTRDYQNQTVAVSQTRYLANNAGKDSDDEATWWVPLSYSTEKDPNFNQTQPTHWLAKNEKSKVLDIKIEETEWILLNNRAAGLYRVNYDEKNWKLLIAALCSPKYINIDRMNRAQLIADAIDLANSRIIGFDLALSLISYIERETDFVPWYAALSKLEFMKSKLSRTHIYGEFKNVMQLLLKSIVKKLKQATKQDALMPFEDGRLLTLVAAWACPLNAGGYGDIATLLFRKWSNTKTPHLDNPIPMDMRRAVYTHAVEYGGERVWTFLWEQYKRANIGSEKNNILMALTNAKETWIINRYLEWTLTDTNGIRKQDAFLIFSATAARDVGFYVAQKFFFRNIERISNYFGGNSNLIGQYFTAIAEQMIYPYEYEELKEFAVMNKELLAPASLTVDQALETVLLNTQWMEQNYESVASALRNFVTDANAKLCDDMRLMATSTKN